MKQCDFARGPDVLNKRANICLFVCLWLRYCWYFVDSCVKHLLLFLLGEMFLKKSLIIAEKLVPLFHDSVGFPSWRWFLRDGTSSNLANYFIDPLSLTQTFSYFYCCEHILYCNDLHEELSFILALWWFEELNVYLNARYKIYLTLTLTTREKFKMSNLINKCRHKKMYSKS